MPSLACWIATALVTNRTATLEALYAGWKLAWPIRPEMEEMLPSLLLWSHAGEGR